MYNFYMENFDLLVKHDKQEYNKNQFKRDPITMTLGILAIYAAAFFAHRAYGSIIVLSLAYSLIYSLFFVALLLLGLHKISIGRLFANKTGLVLACSITSLAASVFSIFIIISNLSQGFFDNLSHSPLGNKIGIAGYFVSAIISIINGVFGILEFTRKQKFKDNVKSANTAAEADGVRQPNLDNNSTKIDLLNRKKIVLGAIALLVSGFIIFTGADTISNMYFQFLISGRLSAVYFIPASYCTSFIITFTVLGFLYILKKRLDKPLRIALAIITILILLFCAFAFVALVVDAYNYITLSINQKSLKLYGFLHSVLQVLRDLFIIVFGIIIVVDLFHFEKPKIENLNN